MSVTCTKPIADPPKLTVSGESTIRLKVQMDLSAMTFVVEFRITAGANSVRFASGGWKERRVVARTSATTSVEEALRFTCGASGTSGFASFTVTAVIIVSGIERCVSPPVTLQVPQWDCT